MTAPLNRLWSLTALYFVSLPLHTPTTKKVLCIWYCGDVVDPSCQVKTKKECFFFHFFFHARHASFRWTCFQLQLDSRPYFFNLLLYCLVPAFL